ncbi:MAG: hypothetical protein ACRDSK_28730 [Actinophytocola sp.]|uniref:hypothetical protein n=1 Tax=Actinophytocola sp. TaxID=1872138 RepID=UPI003D6AA77E
MEKETSGTGHRWPLWPWLVLTVAGIVVTGVAAIVGTVAGSDSSEGETPAATRVTVTATQFETKTITQTVTETPPPGPLPSFSDGLFEVGVDVQPGTYRTEGPSGGNAGGCYWSRSGADGDVIDNGVLNDQGSVNIRKGERIDSAGCLPWRRAP